MNILRWMLILCCLVISVGTFYLIQVRLSQVLAPGESMIIWFGILMIWFSMEMGTFAFQTWQHERRSKQIQSELDMERSFRKLSKKWEQPE